MLDQTLHFLETFSDYIRCYLGESLQLIENHIVNFIFPGKLYQVRMTTINWLNIAFFKFPWTAMSRGSIVNQYRRLSGHFPFISMLDMYFSVRVSWEMDQLTFSAVGDFCVSKKEIIL